MGTNIAGPAKVGIFEAPEASTTPMRRSREQKAYCPSEDSPSGSVLYLAALAETPCCSPLVSAAEDELQQEAIEAPYGTSVVES